MQDHPWSKIKIGVIGNAGVGKTSLLRREVNQVYDEPFYCTIGVDFLIKTYQINNNTVKAMLWDTAGA